jgi:hypothetical protein
MAGVHIRRQIWQKYFEHMYANGKMKPVETIPRMRGEVVKETVGGGEFNYDKL